MQEELMRPSGTTDHSLPTKLAKGMRTGCCSGPAVLGITKATLGH